MKGFFLLRFKQLIKNCDYLYDKMLNVKFFLTKFQRGLGRVHVRLYLTIFSKGGAVDETIGQN